MYEIMIEPDNVYTFIVYLKYASKFSRKVPFYAGDRWVLQL